MSYTNERLIQAVSELGMRGKFDKHSVTVDAEVEWLCSSGGQAAFFLIANLLMRLYPVITKIFLVIRESVDVMVNTPLLAEGELAFALAEFCSHMPCGVEYEVLSQAPSCSDQRVVIGSLPAVSGSITHYIDPLGWGFRYARTASKLGVPSESENPVGAHLAATYSVSEVFKEAILASKEQPTLPVVPRESELLWSSIDYQQHDSYGSMPHVGAPSSLGLDGLSIVGLGSGGMAVVHTLTTNIRLEGPVMLVDPDEITWPNLDRYIVADSRHAAKGYRKVDVAAALLGAQGAKPAAHACAYSDLNVPRELHTVISAVDNFETRHLIQSDLPHQILDAAADRSGNYVISRVMFGAGPCIGCLYTSDTTRIEENQSLASKLGWSEARVAHMRENNRSFSRSDVSSLMTRLPSSELPLEGQRFSDWLAVHCGRGDALTSIEKEVPLGHCTVMPGILVAAELLKMTWAPERLLEYRYLGNVLGNRLGVLSAIKASTACPFCATEAFRSRYTEKWGEES